MSSYIGISPTEYRSTDSAHEWSRTQNFKATIISDAANIDWDLELNQVTQVTLAGNRTMNAPTNLKAGAFYVITVIQDATGSRTLSWNVAFKFPNGVAPILSLGVGSKDVFVFSCDGTSLFQLGSAFNLS